MQRRRSAGCPAPHQLAFFSQSASNSGAIGFKANVAPKLLINFNLRFAIGENGLADRVAPLVGFEWAF